MLMVGFTLMRLRQTYVKSETPEHVMRIELRKIRKATGETLVSAYTELPLKQKCLYIFLSFIVTFQAVTCPHLSIPPRANLLNDSCGDTYGSNCVFGCQTGYVKAEGNVTRTCLQTGQWSGNSIRCTGTWLFLI